MKKLLDITNIGSMTLKNRFVRSAIGDYAVNGHLNEEVYKLYEDLAKGGVGTIITGFSLVDESEKSAPTFSMYDDKFIDEYKKLTDRVHKHGANIILQLVYLGSYPMGDITGQTVLGPSAVANLASGVIPKEMSITEIKDIQQKFANAALRAKKAGFDGVEIHGAHGFLLSQFMTPYYNQRTDIYGGNTENRARMLLETYSAVREKVGEEFPIAIKIQCYEGFEGGVEFEDCRYLCKELSTVGINAIDISGGWHTLSKKDTYFKEEASQIAKDNNIPVIVTGGNRNFDQMENLLNDTDISYFGLARPFICEPDLVNNYKNKKSIKVKCVSCNGCANPNNVGKCIFNK